MSGSTNRRSLINCKVPDFERFRRYDQDLVPEVGADDNSQPPAVPPLKGVTCGKSNKAWNRLYSLYTMIPNQKIQLVFVDSTTPGSQQYGCLYHILSTTKAVFKWNGSAYAAYTPSDGQCWLSVSSNVSFRKQVFVYASGTMYKANLT